MSIRCPRNFTIGSCCVYFAATLSSMVLSPSSTTFPEVFDDGHPFKSCRSIGYDHSSLINYMHDTCAKCYCYLDDNLLRNKSERFWIDPVVLQLRRPYSDYLVYADPSNFSASVTSNFISDVATRKWKECCDSAVECCKTMSRTPPRYSNETVCPRTWDGWTCWEDTPSGSVAKKPCPAHAYSGEPPSCTHFASKTCEKNGQWYRIPGYFEWTNYTQCGASKLNHRRLLFKIITFSVSAASLIPAIIIFTAYRQLRVYRISMHKNFFLSLLLNCVVHIVFESVVMLDVVSGIGKINAIERNLTWCKVLFVLTKYFRMTNYMWMLCEGFYLHKLIAAAFAEQKGLTLYLALGWGFPTIPVTVYSILRKVLNDERCWIFPFGHYEWIMDGTYLISLLLNLIFLCHIIWVLVTKLRNTKSNETAHYRKAVKATLVLLPLFGLHFIVVMYKPKTSDCVAQEVYHYFNHGLDGLQGFLVSLLYCYLNNEVHYLIKRSYERFKMKRNPNHADQRNRAKSMALYI